MTNRKEVKIQTWGPDGGNLTPRVTRALCEGVGRGAAREGASGGSHRCMTVSNESEAP